MAPPTAQQLRLDSLEEVVISQKRFLLIPLQKVTTRLRGFQHLAVINYEINSSGQDCIAIPSTYVPVLQVTRSQNGFQMQRAQELAEA